LAVFTIGKISILHVYNKNTIKPIIRARLYEGVVLYCFVMPCFPAFCLLVYVYYIYVCAYIYNKGTHNIEVTIL